MSPALPPIDGPRARAVTAIGRLVSGLLVTLGLLGVLKTSLDDLGSDSAEEFLVFTVHPLTGLAWLLLGLVGVAMCARTAGCRAYLVGAGVLLALWALLAVAIGDSATQLLTRDGDVVALHLALAALSLLAAAAPFPRALATVLDRPADAAAGEEAEPH
ncbi:DUF4383 domain-containing protein [Miltoncostaea marina]|uniref:DUF4383 domain-containing protein n=1 Tax=Miltoncostaea marina TaxID=2843215 RepID=UPI001C3CCE0B|nr:DUF4383 domain-containing protein [Miltoncostaea marina]